jgi:RecA/RadA recombinase
MAKKAITKKAVKKTATKSNFFKKISDGVKNSSIMSDAVGTGEYSGTIDTGCLILNALVSGSIFGGIQDNKTLALAGDPATGKTYIAMSILTEYLKQNPDAGALHMDTESATTKEMMVNRGIDTDRVILNEPITVEDFRDTVLDTLNIYDAEKGEAPPMIMILDSLGQLSTNKEIKDINDKKDTKDMTRVPLIKGAFRVIRNRLAKSKVPLIVTNHIYASQGGMGAAQKVISGGSGMLYTADTILMLTAKAEEDKGATTLIDSKFAKEYSGIVIKVTTYKARLTKPKKSIEIRVSFTKGLDKFYGLLPLAEKYGILKKDGNRYLLPDGRKVFGKEINENPDSVYTQEVLELIDAAAKTEFCFGEGEGPVAKSIDDDIDQAETEMEDTEA